MSLVLVVGACADPRAAEQGGPTGVPWELEAGTIGGSELTLVDGHPITLNLTEESASGTAACNGYSAEVSMTEGDIAFSEMTQTAMACSPAQVMESETQYLEAMSRVDRYDGTRDRLTLSGEGVDLIFMALSPVPIEELTGTVWVLESLIDGDSVSNAVGDRTTLELYTDGSMLGSTGCRSLHGSYTVSGAEIVMTEMFAEGDCPQDLMDQDSHVVTVLGDGFRAAVEEQTLTLTSRGARGLVYRADG